MNTHLSEEHMIALLHGSLAEDARGEARRHLAACSTCAAELARQAALDEILWETRQAFAETPALALRGKPRPRRSAAVPWVLVGAAAVVAVAALGYAGSTAATRSVDVGLFAWQNLIFYIPLVVGLLLALGSALGGHHHDASADHDIGHDVEGGHAGHDAGDHATPEHHHDANFAARALSLLGVGRVPITVVLMMASLLFGGLGLVLNRILAATGAAAWVYGPISAVAAFAGTIVLTGSAARLIHRILPGTETYPISRHGLAGCTGTLLLPADSSSGYAQVKDSEGNVHNIKCRTTSGTLPKGQEILIVEYDEETSTYVVDANPVPRR